MTPPIQRLWVPGTFWTTNEAYKQMRALAPDRPPSEVAAELRGFVRVLATTNRPSLAPVKYVSVWFDWYGSGREDPDAWTWAGKHILDGITDARVIPSDRKNVYSVGGRCAQSLAEMRMVLARAGAGVSTRSARECVGVMVTLAPTMPSVEVRS